MISCPFIIRFYYLLQFPTCSNPPLSVLFPLSLSTPYNPPPNLSYLFQSSFLFPVCYRSPPPIYFISLPLSFPIRSNPTLSFSVRFNPLLPFYIRSNFPYHFLFFLIVLYFFMLVQNLRYPFLYFTVRLILFCPILSVPILSFLFFQSNLSLSFYICSDPYIPIHSI